MIGEGVFYPNIYNRKLWTGELLVKLGALPSPPDVLRRVLEKTPQNRAIARAPAVRN